MSKAILLAVARDAELEARVGELGRAASRALMKRLFLDIARLHLEPLPPAGDLLSLPHVLKNLRAKEEEVIRKGEDHRETIGIGPDREPEEQEGGADPGQPLDLYRQDEHHVDDFVWIKPGEREEKRSG